MIHGRIFALLGAVVALGFGPASGALTTQPAGAGPWSSLGDAGSAQGWHLQPSDGVSASLAVERDSDGRGVLRLDVDFTSGAGFVVLGRDVDLTLPENYAVSMDVKGTLPANNLELKLVDQPTGKPPGAGENVWWVNRKAFEFPADFKTVVSHARQFQFAWGPNGGAKLDRVRRIEVAIASSTGGRGSVWLRDLKFRSLPASTGEPKAASITASSTRDPGSDAANLVTDKAPGWASAVDAKEATLTAQLASSSEVGGLTITWGAGQHPLDYQVQTSDDGQNWATVRQVRRSNGGIDVVPTPGAQGAWVRLVMRDSVGSQGFAIQRLVVHGGAFAETPTAYLEALGASRPRGWYPRNLTGEQAYWTVIGAAGDSVEALLSEDGQVEVAKRGFTIEPFAMIEGKPGLLTWAEATALHVLAEGFLPIPSVTRDYESFQIATTAWVTGPADKSVLWIRYRLYNRTDEEMAGKLFVALRPIQVIPPWHRLNYDGGHAPITSIRFQGRDAFVNGQQVRFLLPPQPSGVGAVSGDEGDVVEWMARGEVPSSSEVNDPTGMASGAASWSMKIPPKAFIALYAAVPLHGDLGPAGDPAKLRGSLSVLGESQLRATFDEWKNRLAKVQIDIPDEELGKDVLDTFRSQLAYILINQDGPGIQPGSRSYERSWIRDGSMTSAALLSLGMAAEVRPFVEWYASKQFPSGKVPCVVDTRGPDPVPEHDSHGQLIWAIAAYARQTGDDALLRDQYPRIAKAVEYIQTLRRERMTEAYSGKALSTPEPGKPAVPLRAFYGLLPESISHEGYSAKPMHSYWDDLFALRGLREAVWAAQRLGKAEDVQAWSAIRDDFTACLRDSIALTMKTHGIDYVPGCVELGDFDATSTSIALDPVSAEDVVPEAALRRTFAKYVEHVRERASKPSTYTPYEWRNVGALVRLGMKAEAWEVTRALLKDRRPTGWNAFAEVVYPGYRDRGFLGDLPHTWCGSDYLRAVLTMFEYYREPDDALVVLAGVPQAWARSLKGVGFTDLHTRCGPLSVRAVNDGSNYKVRLAGPSLTMPKGGIVVCTPGESTPTSVTVNGQPGVLSGGRVTIHELPAEVVFTHP